MDAKTASSTWADAIHTEVAFWRGQMEDIKADRDPSLAWRIWPREFEPRYMELVREDRRNVARVLDVGAGPFTHQGCLSQGKALDLTCVDPLAVEYRDLCAEYKITPPIRTVLGFAERLTALFATDSFDLVTSTNALDHSMAPFEAIGQMFAVCRPGGSVFIEVVENVGEVEKYFGLHQHNFTIDGDAFILWYPDGQRIDICRAFSSSIGSTHLDRNHPWRQFEWGKHTISAHFVKRD
jgi:SAM-dependent methyltransferase